MRSVRHTVHVDVGQTETLLTTRALESAIFNNPRFSCIATDTEGVIQLFNVGAERMLGYLALEVVNKITPAELHDPQEVITHAAALSVEYATPIAPGFEALVFKAARGIEDIYELTKVRKDGSRFPAVVSVSALRDAQGAIIGYLLIGTENTAREKAMEERNRFFALSRDMLCTLGFDGYYKNLNPAWEKTLGYTTAQILATPFIEFVHPDDRQATLLVTKNIASGVPVIGFENRYRCKDGSYRHFLWSATRVFEDQLIYGSARDITESKQAEAAVLKAGALQKAIFDSANFSSIATDANGVIQIFNVGAERMLGYTAADVMNKITPADISDPQEVIARAAALSVELGTPITPGFEALVFKASRGIEDIYELTYIRKDGSRFPAVVSVTALRDAEDVVIGYLLIGTDNTARKHAEEALLKAGALQKAIFDSANFSSIATDAKGVIQIFNVGAERMLGYTAAEVMNRITPADISDPQEVIARAKTLSVELRTQITPGFEALVFKASRGIEDIYELTYIRKDGSRFPAVVSVTALRDAQDVVIGYLLIGTDNTARKQAEEALLKAGALQKAIFDSANFSSIATDAKGVIQIFNVGAERMLGYTAAEVMNKITPADISDPQEVIARAKTLSVELGTQITPGFEALVFKASRGIEDIYELTYIRKDGSRFPAVVSVTALRDAQNVVIGYLLIGTDNTARKLAEEERNKLDEALEEIRQNQMRFKDEFLSHVSHELRSPLTAIKQFTTILLGGLAGELNKEQREYQQIVLRNIRQLQAMIDDLLEVTRLETGKLTVELERVSVMLAVADTFNTLQGTAQTKGVSLSCDLPPNLPAVNADATRLRQILIILLDNAIKFTPEGGAVTIRARLQKKDPRFLLLEVSDTGCGISPDIGDRIFERLYQVSERTETSRKGLGLGLHICKELVTRQGGWIRAERRPQIGSTFSFTLPVFSLNTSLVPSDATQLEEAIASHINQAGSS